MKRFFFIAIALFIGGKSIAQDSTVNLNEVIVTANRIAQKQSQTGKTISVIGKDILEKSKAQSVAQVLNEQVGITVNGAVNNLGTNQTVFLRGANRGRVLILLDGIPMGDPSDIDNVYDLNFLSVQDIERIEIARGNQSTLYGSDAIAGVINIITNKKNHAKPLQFRSTLIGGNYNSLKGNVQFFGKKNKLNYQASYSKIKTKGFSSANDSSGNNNFDRDGYNGNSLRANLDYQMTPNLSFKAFSQYSGYKTDLDKAAFADDRDYFIENKNINAGAGFQFQNDRVSVTGNYNYSEYKRFTLNDSADFSDYFKQNYFSKSQYLELYTSVVLSKTIKLVQGGDFRYGSYNNNYLSISEFGPYNSVFKDTSVSQSSMYASLLYASKNSKLNVEMGGRLNLHSQYGTNYTNTFSASYNLNKTYRLLGSISSGFKAPTLYQLYGEVSNNALKPENSINYEFGVAQNNQKLTQRLMYFYREVKQGIDFDNINNIYFNFQKQIVRGLEYEASYVISPSLTATANYCYLNGTDLTQSRISFADTTYSYLLRRPSHSGNIRISYQHKDKWSLSINGKFVSARKDIMGYQEPDLLLRGYCLLNTYGEYKLHNNARLFFDIQNITNTKFSDLRGYNSIPFLINGGIIINY